MKKYLYLILIIVCLVSNPYLEAKKRKSPAIPGSISLETPEEYVDRMIDNIQYYIDIGYYTEALYFLKDLTDTNEKGLRQETITEIRTKLNSLYGPEKENSTYNSDILRKVKDFTGKYGYIDHTGEFIIPAEFEQAEEFSDGLALVKRDKQRFFINREGESVIQFDPEEIEIRRSFHSGLALCYYRGKEAEHGSGYIYIDKAGNEKIFLPKYGKFKVGYDAYDFSEGFAVVGDAESDLYGYIDTDGKWLVEPTFDKAFPFRNGMAIVSYPNNDLYAYINTSGRSTFQLPIMEAWHYRDEVTMVKTRESYEYIDKSGGVFYDSSNEKLSKKPCLVYMSPRSNGLIPLQITEGRGDKNKDGIIFVDRNNRRSLEWIEEDDIERISDFQEVIGFTNGRAFVKSKYSGWGMINLKGDFVVKPQLQWKPLSSFYNGLAKIEYRNEESGVRDVRYINREGKIVFIE